MLRPLRFMEFALVLAGTGLTGCCFECIDSSDAHFLTFAFSPDSTGGTGFRRAELRSVYVVTYGRPGFQGTADTSRQATPGTPASTSLPLSIYPSPTSPIGRMTFSLYAQPGSPFSYRIFVPAAGRVYAIDDVSHVFEENKGGCTCRIVQEKRFTVDGKPEVQLREQATTGLPVTVLVR